MNSTIDQFRRAGHDVVDWIADYLEDARKYPVLPSMKPGELVDRLPSCAPERGEPIEAMIEDFHKLILPAVTHWNHPRFMAYFGISASAPGILGEMLASAINANGMVWKSSPAGTELEIVAMNWLRQWLGLPEEFFGIVYDTASVSTFTAIAAARELAAPEVRDHGLSPKLVLYTSEQAHSSVEKGAIALGIGRSNVRKIGVDAEFRMRPDLLEAAVKADLESGRKPFCVAATTGTTSTTSVDPVPAIADIAERYGLWLHIDAAYGGSAAILPECRWVLEGAERCDSLVMNPHKWLFTPIDFSAFYTRRPEILRRAFSLVPEYLRTEENPRAVNYMDYGVQLGRRFRALKLWFVMRHYGREGVCEILRSHIRWAQEVAAAVDADPRFERAAPAPFSVVCFRYKGSDDDNRKLIETVNATGEVFLSSTVLNGRFVLRMAIGNIGTTRDDVQAVWELVKQSAAALESA
jgi:aromatic-L-amino-acid/L-tryptophan decarboxylase